jgi:hypothetical protein
MEQFNRIDHLQYKHRLGKKMGYAVTNAQMSSVMSQKKIENPMNPSGTKETQDSKKFDSSGHVRFQSLAPNASRDTVNAWFAAAEKTGVNGFDGSDTQLSVMFAMQAEQKAATGSSDLLGKTSESAAAVVKKAISRLDGMSGEVVNTKVKEYRAKEMDFYKELLSQLEDD